MTELNRANYNVYFMRGTESRMVDGANQKKMLEYVKKDVHQCSFLIFCPEVV